MYSPTCVARCAPSFAPPLRRTRCARWQTKGHLWCARLHALLDAHPLCRTRCARWQRRGARRRRRSGGSCSWRSRTPSTLKCRWVRHGRWLVIWRVCGRLLEEGGGRVRPLQPRSAGEDAVLRFGSIACPQKCAAQLVGCCSSAGLCPSLLQRWLVAAAEQRNVEDNPAQPALTP